MKKLIDGPMIRGAFVQTRPVFGKNQTNAEEAIKIASKVKSDIYVFPELSTTGYAFTTKEECMSLAETTSGPSIELFRQFAEKKKCIVVAGFAEREESKIYNSSVIIERGEVLGTYRKMHLFYREKLWFERADTGFKIFESPNLGCKFGVLICFDWLFPEAWRELTLGGADIVCHPSNLVIPGKAQVGTQIRAFENRIFVITANRVGTERRSPKDNFKYTGRSQIISPLMEKLTFASSTETVAKVAKLDITKSRNKNVTELNNVKSDRRLEFYTENCKEQEYRLRESTVPSIRSSD